MQSLIANPDNADAVAAHTVIHETHTHTLTNELALKYSLMPEPSLALSFCSLMTSHSSFPPPFPSPPSHMYDVRYAEETLLT